MELMIICPNSGDLIRTGISMDPESFASSNFSNNSVTCRCGEIHTWSKEDVELVREQ